ncbi:SusD/RagB family nutrient-binding outer membrane lipoprotein [Flavihumibacter solisilvae]|uniref:SusD/RagB family nutrient-binding outer membrane lipoprotein n=1 Tax=Flavihumibacter solisilvae TaxID=1349421 RepID=A0A0C1IUM7_9BACT|nr:SusD/RagB family nutrient-binding outer membrane lipoprotein [Flavihumibacter solisilvae]KIC94194.1 hypothetical protein OI18_13230 [Flavihumibacter solisilvae]
MKQHKLIFGGLLALSLFTMSGCTKDFKETNTDPNRMPEARPELLLESAIYSAVKANQTRALRLTHELMQVHVTTINSDEIHRYIIRPSESDYMWNAWYLQMTNFRDMYETAKKLRNLPNQTYYDSYMGMALIMDTWLASLATDTYGDVPYTDANKGRSDNLYQPTFDRQQVIYDSMFHKLEEANTLLAQNIALPAANLVRDPLFAGNISQWRKFGNSLYLRLLLRASDRPESNAVVKIKEICETNTALYPLMNSNAESAVLRFTTTAPFVSAFNTYRDYDFNGDNGLTQFFINTLNNWADPRLTKWANTVGGVYEGIPSGYAPGQQPERMSSYNAALKNEPLLGNILNYAEVQFMLAEASLKGYFNGTSQTYYNNGVNNAITFWGLAVPVDHLLNPAITWVDAETTEQKMEKIITQKYFTLFFTDFQSWYEHRRTGYPVLPVGPGVQNNGEMPARLQYPVSVQSLNRTNYDAAVSAMGGDQINVKVWWQKD